MIQLSIDEKRIEEMALEAIEEKLKMIDRRIYFMDSKQFLEYVNMSWNTANELFFSDPAFQHVVIRLGNRFLYNRKELDAYLDKFCIAVRDNGGDIKKYKRRNA